MVNFHHHHHHHHKHPGLGHLARSVSRVTVALSIVSSVSRLFSFLVGCSEIILKGFGFVAFFAGVKASSFCNGELYPYQYLYMTPFNMVKMHLCVP
jgi:hypothetical protein